MISIIFILSLLILCAISHNTIYYYNLRTKQIVLAEKQLKSRFLIEIQRPIDSRLTILFSHKGNKVIF